MFGVIPLSIGPVNVIPSQGFKSIPSSQISFVILFLLLPILILFRLMWGVRIRFAEVVVIFKVWWLEMRGKISSSMLSPATTYAAYLVFRMRERRYFGFDIDPIDAMVGIVGGEHYTKRVSLDPYLGDPDQRHRCVPRAGSNLPASSNMSELEQPKERHDGWFETELGEFHNDGEDDEVEIILKEVKCIDSKNGLVLQGIEIRPKMNLA